MWMDNVNQVHADVGFSSSLKAVSLFTFSWPADHWNTLLNLFFQPAAGCYLRPSHVSRDQCCYQTLLTSWVNTRFPRSAILQSVFVCCGRTHWPTQVVLTSPSVGGLDAGQSLKPKYSYIYCKLCTRTRERIKFMMRTQWFNWILLIQHDSWQQQELTLQQSSVLSGYLLVLWQHATEAATSPQTVQIPTDTHTTKGQHDTCIRCFLQS